MDGVAQPAPLIERRIKTELLGTFDAAIARDPRHHFRRNVVLSGTADFPDALIGLAPYFGQMLQDRAFEVQLPLSRSSLATRD